MDDSLLKGFIQIEAAERISPFNELLLLLGGVKINIFKKETILHGLQLAHLIEHKLLIELSEMRSHAGGKHADRFSKVNENEGYS